MISIRRGRRRIALLAVGCFVASLSIHGAAAQPVPNAPGFRLAEPAPEMSPDSSDEFELSDEPLPLAPMTSVGEPRGIDRVCPPPAGYDLPAGDDLTYPDLGTAHADALSCASRYSLISGFEDGTMRPGQPVTRAQTASVVAGWIGLATGFDLAPPAEQPFEDVAGTHADAIAALADIGVLAGRGDGTFRPHDALTRGQFTRVVANAISYADVFAIGGPLPPVPTDEPDLFDDVAGTTFEQDILALATAKITVGTDARTFSPNTRVTRGQLATFSMRAADYLDRHQRWRPTARTVRLATDLQVWRDADPATDELTGDRATPMAAVSLQVNAFNGTAAYIVDLSELPPILDDAARLVVRIGTIDAGGPVVLVLASGGAIHGSDIGVIQGAVVEADSLVRFADLVASPERVVVELEAGELPGGSLRGVLRALE